MPMLPVLLAAPPLPRSLYLILLPLMFTLVAAVFINYFGRGWLY